MHKTKSPQRPKSCCGCDWLEVSLSREWLEIVEKTPWFENLMARGSRAWAKEGQRWNINGNSLVYLQPKQNQSGRISATGQLGNEFLEVLSALVSRDDDGIIVRRVDIKVTVKMSNSIKNWELLRKRQTAAEAKKSNFARKVELITSKTGSTLAIGTRGNNTYCRIEYSQVEEKVSFELEYRKKKAKIVGKKLLKSREKEKNMQYLLQTYLKTLVKIRILTNLLNEELANGKFVELKIDSEGIKKNKKYFDSVCIPFLRKMFSESNLKMKIYIAKKLLVSLVFDKL